MRKLAATTRSFVGRKNRPSVKDAPPRSLEPSKLAKILTWVVLITVAIYFLFPLYWLIVATTKNNTDLASTNGLWFSRFSLVENYNALMAWTRGMYWRWVLNSVFYSTTAAAFGSLFSLMAGYALAKYRLPAVNIVLGVIMAGLLMPVALLTIPLYLQFHWMGLHDTIWAILIPSVVSPFGVFLGRVYAESSVPTEIIEAARIDGASEIRIFFTIVLRILAPAMVTIFLFIFVSTWNNFMLPLMMITKPSLEPVTLGLYGMITYYNPVKGAVLMGVIFGVLPLILIFLGLQKYWRAGLAAGSVKG